MNSVVIDAVLIVVRGGYMNFGGLKGQRYRPTDIPRQLVRDVNQWAKPSELVTAYENALLRENLGARDAVELWRDLAHALHYAGTAIGGRKKPTGGGLDQTLLAAALTAFAASTARLVQEEVFGHYANSDTMTKAREIGAAASRMAIDLIGRVSPQDMRAMRARQERGAPHLTRPGESAPSGGMYLQVALDALQAPLGHDV